MLNDEIKSRIVNLNDDYFIAICVGAGRGSAEVREEIIKFLNEKDYSVDKNMDISSFKKESRAAFLFGTASLINKFYINKYEEKYGVKVVDEEYLKSINLDDYLKDKNNMVIIAKDADLEFLGNISKKLSENKYELELSYLNMPVENVVRFNMDNYFGGKKEIFVDPQDIVNTDAISYANFEFLRNSEAFKFVNAYNQMAPREASIQNLGITELTATMEKENHVKNFAHNLLVGKRKDTSIAQFYNAKQKFQTVTNFVTRTQEHNIKKVKH